jgi:nicotinate-nucleotide adenylyltransferase
MRRRPARPVQPCAKRARTRGRKIGLFGGSFNPAHEGHRHVSLLALKRLGLHEVWWLVSPQNPLKPTVGMAPFDTRLAQAQQIARHPKVRVTDIERRLGSRYTVDTLARLKRRFPRLRWVWIMGADNLLSLAEWRRWPLLFQSVPVAIFDRWPYSRYVRVAKPTRRFAHKRVAESRAAGLVRRKAPAWALIHSRLHPASATALRAKRPASERADGG